MPPSEKQPEALTQSTFEILQELEIKAEAEPDALSPSLKDAATFDLRNNIDRTLFFGFYNEVADALLPTLDVSCQVLYNRLFRLSYGFNRNYCTVSQPILMEKTGLSRNTVRTGLQSLTKAGWIQIVESGNRISTTYRIVLPREQSEHTTIRLPKFDPQNLTLKSRPSKSEAQKQTVKNRRSKFASLEGQISEAQNLTSKTKNSGKILNSNILHPRGSNFEGQKWTPLLSLTNRSLTLSKRELDLQNSKPKELKTLGEKLVSKFYSQLGQRASKTKHEQSVKQCLTLFDDGFTPEEIDYAIDWLIEHHPETGAFSRVQHFIDQAIKVKQAQQQAMVDKDRRRAEAEQQAQIEAQQAAEREQIAALFDSLSASVRKELEQQAAQLVQDEHGQVQHGREILIRLKIEELIRDQHLASE